MNKRLFSVFVAVALLGSAVPALAQGRSPSSSPERPSLRERVQNIFQRNEERREQVREQITERRQQQLRSWWERTEARLNRLLSHLDRIAGLIQDRIDRLTAAGRDTAQLQEQMDDAYLKIDEAKASVAEAGAKIEEILASGEEPSAIFRELRALHREVLDDIKAAHRALIKVLAATRGFSVTPTPEASVTASPTATPTS